MYRITRLLFFISSLVVVVLLLGWAVCSIPLSHDYCKKKLENKLSLEIGNPVKIDKIAGILPFSININKIDIYEKDGAKKVVAISNFSCIPSWFDIILGKIAFFKVNIERIELFESKGNDKKPFSHLSAYLPSQKVIFRSLNIKEIILPSTSLEKLQATKIQELSSEIWGLKGNFFYNPKVGTLDSKLEITPLNSEPLHLKLVANKNTVEGSVKCVLYPKIPDLQKIYLNLDVASKNSSIINKIWEISSPHDSDELFTGNFQLQGSYISEDHIEHPEILTEVKLTCSKEKVITFTTSQLKICHLPFFHCDSSSSLCEHRNFKPTINLLSQLSGTISFPYNSLSEGLNLELNEAKFNFNDRIISNLSGKACIHKENNLWKGNLSSAFSLVKSNTQTPVTVPFTLSFDVQKQEESIAINKIALQSPTLELSGNLNFFKSYLLGSIKALSSDLSPIAGILSYNLSGEAKAECLFTKDRSSISLMLDKIHTSELYAEKGNLQINGNGDYSNLTLDLSTQIQGMSWSHFQFNEVKLTSHATYQNKKLSFPFDFQIDGSSDKGPLSLKAKGNLQKEDDTIVFETSDFLAITEKRELALSNPLNFEYKKGNIKLSPFKFTVGESGFFEGELFSTLEGLAGNFTAKQLPLELLNFVIPNNPLAGTVSCEGFVYGTKEIPRIHLELTSNALIWNGPHNDLFSSFETCVQADIGHGRMLASGEIKSSKEETPLVWEFSIPIKLNTGISPFFVISENDTISGSISGDTRIAPILAHSLQENEIIEGLLSCNLSLSGTLKNPDLSGSLSIHNGKLDIFKTGGIFSDIDLKAIIKDNELFVGTLNASDEKGGSLKSQGTIKLSRKDNFPYLFSLNSKNMEIIKKDFASVSVTGTGTLSGNMKEMKIQGDVSCDNAEINLMSDFSSNLPSIDFTYLNGPYAKQKKLQGFTTFLDIKAHIPKDHGKISGRGLNSFWKGDLKISGKASDLRVLGEVDLSKGTFTLVEKEFTITKGQIDFFGNIFTESRVTANAIYDTPQLLTELFVRGPIQSLRLSIRSNPPLPEKDILSILLFNKSFSEISPLESLQVAQALLSVSQSTSRFDFLKTIKKQLYIDKIEISRTVGSDIDDNNNLSFTIGKYLSKKFLLTLSKDVVTDVNRAGIEATLTNKLSVSCQIGDDNEGQIQFLWKHSYE